MYAGTTLLGSCALALKTEGAWVLTLASKNPSDKGITSSTIARRLAMCLLRRGCCHPGTVCLKKSGNLLLPTSYIVTVACANMISEPSVPASAFAYARAIALALWKRRCGSLSNARKITCSTEGERAGLMWEGGCGCSRRCFQYTDKA